MTPRELEEYRALRATIRERGTARACLFAAIVPAWAILTVAAAAAAPYPAAALFPLLTLAAGFEAIFALHLGVERVGRYLQVFYEDAPGERQWERTVMAFGQAFPGGGSDPLFARYFALATAANLIPAALVAPTALEWLTIGAAHLLFLIRIAAARRVSAAQRAVDRERFETLRNTRTAEHAGAASHSATSASEP